MCVGEGILSSSSFRPFYMLCWLVLGFSGCLSVVVVWCVGLCFLLLLRLGLRVVLGRVPCSGADSLRLVGCERVVVALAGCVLNW